MGTLLKIWSSIISKGLGKLKFSEKKNLFRVSKKTLVPRSIFKLQQTGTIKLNKDLFVCLLAIMFQIVRLLWPFHPEKPPKQMNDVLGTFYDIVTILTFIKIIWVLIINRETFFGWTM